MFISQKVNPLVNLLLLIMIVVNGFSQELIPNSSSYSSSLGVLDCNNVEPLRGCRHEIGHKMDDDLGRPSSSEEFAIAVEAYAILNLDLLLNPDEVAMFIRLYPDKRSNELYAGLYSYVDGDISKLPKSLQQFFSKDPAYLNLYDCLARQGFNMCDGLNFSFLKG